MGDLWSFSNKIPGLFEAGDLVGERYEVIEKIGQGQSGIVYKALDKNTDDVVALKVLRASTEEIKKRFQREGEISASLDHPQIAKMLNSGEHSGQLFFAFEYIPGLTLDAIDKDKLSPDQQFQILIEIAQGLAYAHSKGIVHRDLKSNNVLIDEAGHPHIVDFGLARAPELESLTETGALVGTPRFMAPEQLKSGGQRALPQSDIWSFGVLIHHLLTGQHPFSGANVTELTHAIVSSSTPNLPPQKDRMLGIQSIFEVCLKKDPKQRCKDGQELFEALKKSASYSRKRFLVRSAKASLLGLLLSPILFLAYTLFFHDPNTALKKSLAAFLKGRLTVEELRAKFDKDQETLHPALKQRVMTVLAQSHLKAERWGQAKDCIESLSKQSEGLGGDGEFIAGQLALHDRRFEDASRHFAQAFKKGAGNDAILQEIQALLLAGKTDRAQLRAEFALGETSIEPLQFTLFLSHAKSSSQAPEHFDTFLDGLNARLAIPELLLLRSHFIREAGGSPRKTLEELVQRHPRSLDGVFALAKQCLYEGEGAQAHRVLVRGKLQGIRHKAIRHYEKQLARLLTRGPLEPLDNQTSPWNRAIQRFLLKRVQRELDCYERSSDPRITHSSPVTKEQHRVRALWDLSAAQKHGAPAELCARLQQFFTTESLQSLPLNDASGLFKTRLTMIRARAFLREQKPSEAGALLEGLKGRNAFQQRSIDLLKARALIFSGQQKQACIDLERLHEESFLDGRICRQLAVLYRDAGDSSKASLHSEHRKDLERRHVTQANQHFMNYQQLKRNSDRPSELIACLDSAIKAYPLHWKAHIKQALFRVADVKPVRGLDEALKVFEFAPQYHSELLGFFQVAWAREGFLRHRERYRFEVVLKQCPKTPRGNLIRAVLQSYAVEILNRSDLIEATVTLLSAALNDNPSATTARLCRAFLYIRARQFDKADDDLSLYEEDQSRSSLSHFYRGLLLAAKGRPGAEVAARLRKVPLFDFALWKRPGWDIDTYPELKNYKEVKEIQAVIGTK
ncbi:MAG: serine/threonine-protein kinase [Planctomycetota bacterium]|nr:serine/threonine-protein kinase [Planctomycetota bacterium]